MEQELWDGIKEQQEKIKLLEQRLNVQEKSNQILVRANQQLIEWIDGIVAEQNHYKENIEFELNDPHRICRSGRYWYPQIATIDETLEEIINNRKSIARFGDGEFSTIEGRIRHHFQNERDEELGYQLKKVLTSNNSSLLVAIADNYGDLSKYSVQTRREIRAYMTPEVRLEQLSLLDRNRKYYNAYITRPYVIYDENEQKNAKSRFSKLQKIWDNKECIFVEGEYTAMGVNNDLFVNARSIQRIIAPAENAYHLYERILNTCLEQSKEKIFLLALGPTATVLAYDLCRLGYQAIDIGHIDLEYEWFLQGTGGRTVVKGKYNNEVANGDQPEKIKEKNYLNQIIEFCV